ncbi:MAG: hypothetical protein HWE13_09505 [Gammaproteobacteria bacterium]|nr:hypothetical protein [Gammaproteobacteria bacterium]NVK88352.1 hypothetical protein [Gammaproteobacteria bacterium]
MTISKGKLLALMGMVTAILVLLMGFPYASENSVAKVVIFVVAAIIFLLSSRSLRRAEAIAKASELDSPKDTRSQQQDRND